MKTQTPAQASPEDSAATGPADVAVRVANLIVWALASALLALLGVVLIPLTVAGGFLIPVAPVIALAANFLLPRVLFAGTRWGAARFVPAAVWALVALVAASPTSDGDLLIPGDSHSSVVGLAYLGLGALGAVLGIVFSSPAMRHLRQQRES